MSRDYPQGSDWFPEAPLSEVQKNCSNQQNLTKFRNNMKNKKKRERKRKVA